MRLYLSSFQLGDHPEAFSSLVGGARRGWLIMNALDGQDETRRITDTPTQIANLRSIGLDAEDLDLRALNPSTAKQAFGEPDFVWVRGGNVFTLRMAMATSGLDQILTEHTTQDRLVYAGYSAGPPPRPKPGRIGTLRPARTLHYYLRQRPVRRPRDSRSPFRAASQLSFAPGISGTGRSCGSLRRRGPALLGTN